MQTELMKEGWYWHRASDQHKWSCVEVYREDGYWWWSPQRELIDNSYAMENHSTEEWYFIGTRPSHLTVDEIAEVHEKMDKIVDGWNE